MLNTHSTAQPQVEEALVVYFSEKDVDFPWASKPDVIYFGDHTTQSQSFFFFETSIFIIKLVLIFLIYYY